MAGGAGPRRWRTLPHAHGALLWGTPPRAAARPLSAAPAADPTVEERIWQRHLWSASCHQGVGFAIAATRWCPTWSRSRRSAGRPIGPIYLVFVATVVAAGDRPCGGPGAGVAAAVTIRRDLAATTYAAPRQSTSVTR